MKHIQSFASVAVCIAVLAFAATASAQTVKDGVVTVVRIQGSARYSSGDNVWHPLSAGKTLGANDVIETASDSTVDLVLSDKAAKIGMQSGVGSLIGGAINVAGLPVAPLHIGIGQSAPEQNVIRLQADTLLAIDKFTYIQTGADTVSDTELDLKAGKIFGNVKKISAASQFLIKMPTGVAGIRGTALTFDADGTVVVLQGSAVVSEIGSNGQPTTIVLTAGESYNPQTQQATRLTPVELANAIQDAVSIVIAIHAAVTVAETPTASGQDTTTVYISPKSGNSLVLTAGNTPNIIIQ